MRSTKTCGVTTSSGAITPTGTISAGSTITVATGAGTVTIPLPFFPSLVALIVIGPPGAIPVTTPVFRFTVAMLVLELAQATNRPVSMFPLASFNVSESASA